MTTDCSIDWSFIGELEGERSTGYVPNSTDSNNSGVTIGRGFDLGQRNKANLYSFGFSLPLLNKLLPYVGLCGQAADSALYNQPLTLTKDEMVELDQKVSKAYADYIEREYNAYSDMTFSFLDSAKQTVVMSVGFQYGSLRLKCPAFFHMVTKGLWDQAVEELKNFGDHYPSRRLKEAVLLQSSLTTITKKGN